MRVYALLYLGPKSSLTISALSIADLYLDLDYGRTVARFHHELQTGEKYYQIPI